MGFTTTLKLADIAHCCASGINVYKLEFWLSTIDGVHVPVMLLFEVEGSVGTVPPVQILSEVPKLKTGTTLLVTFTVNKTWLAHCPAVGVNVYVAVF